MSSFVSLICGRLQSSDWPAAIAPLDPDLILLDLGTNDVNGGAVPIGFQFDFTGVAGQVRAAS
ncbi:hypothetical protein [Arthrobacter sp.]|uniref:hypothetical protein n=1 Tax=Arthrobacter sp. TaxID=1667 RepID=UPI00339799EC